MYANYSERSSGFTTIELITVVVILGILAVVALPRLLNADYRAQEFRDQVLSAMRYAQKSAVSHRRMTCVSFTATTVTLRIDTAGNGANCTDPLILPGGNTATVQSADAAKAYFNPVPAGTYRFFSTGLSSGLTLSIPGQPDIVVEGATGYVN